MKLFSILLLSLTISACATYSPQIPVEYIQTESSDKSLTISTKIAEKVQMSYPGAGCLLCLGAAAIANGGIAARAKELTNEDLVSLPTEVAAAMEKQGYTTTILDRPVDISKLSKVKFEKNSDARRNFKPLKEKLKASHLLLIDIDYSGFKRDYRNYFPLSEPYAHVTGKAYLVNLETNQYEWYLPIEERNSVGSEWKEGPEYPGLTNSFYQSIATVKDKILSSFERNDNLD